MSNYVKWMLAFCLLPSFLHAQNIQGVDATAAAIVKQIRASGTEKIFLQTDKHIYSTGETIWFKAFVLDSMTDKLTAGSNILYTDLVNDDDSAFYRMRLYAAQLQTNGSVQLSDSMPGGYYWLRAYTNSMLKAGNLTVLPLYISAKQNANTSHEIVVNAQPVDTAHPVIEIFPEGGSLISGADNLVVIKIHDKNGRPITTKGMIKDNRNNNVTSFATGADGMGKFVYSPSWFRKYGVWLQNKTGYDSVTVLPSINFYAGRLSVNSIDNSNIKATVMLEDSIFSPSYTSYVIGIAKDSVCFVAVGKGMYELNISVSNFPQSVAQLLLYNDRNELLSERDIYISKQNASLTVTTDKQTYAARENVKLNIAVADASGKPLLSSLTVTVTDKRIADISKAATANAMNADTSDIALIAQTGTLKNFLAKNKSISQAYKIQDSTFTISGAIKNSKNAPIAKTAISIMTKDKDMNFLQDTTNDAGEFSIDMPFFYDSTKFTIQLNNSKESNKENTIMLNPPLFPVMQTPLYVKQQFATIKPALAAIKTSYDSIVFQNGKGWLPPVNVNTTIDKKSKSKEDRDPGLLTQKALIEGGYNNVGNAVLRSGKFHLLQGYLIAGGSNAFVPSAQDEPLVIMDGVWIQLSGNDAADEKSPVLGFLKSLDPRNIEYIKLLSGPEAGIYGVRSGHGVIEIHTANRIINDVAGPGLKTIYPQGFYRPRFFPMPDYSNHDIKYADTHDMRTTTIYWNGDIVTDATGKTSLQFFTADIPAQYVITVSGVTANGEHLHQSIVIDRK